MPKLSGRGSAKSWLAAAVWVLLGLLPARASAVSLAEDFTGIMGWLTQQTAQGLAFNAGSTFDPPNEMKPWRMQPDLSLGVGYLPFDKSRFPPMHVATLAANDPAGMLPSEMKFPNLTMHMRLGLPGRMDLGFRAVDMTTPKNYRLSPTTTGDGQSNTLGAALRKHFYGGEEDPLLSVTFAYNHVFGYFNFTNEFKNVEFVPGSLYADSVNKGRLEWDVRSFGLNAVLSKMYGKWTPFLGVGYNRIIGSVAGRLESLWNTSLVSPNPIVGDASGIPEPSHARLILGAQRDGTWWSFFTSGEMKAKGAMAGQTFIVSVGLAAPFRIGATSILHRKGGEDMDIPTSKERKLRRKERADIPEPEVSPDVDRHNGSDLPIIR